MLNVPAPLQQAGPGGIGTVPGGIATGIAPTPDGGFARALDRAQYPVRYPVETTPLDEPTCGRDATPTPIWPGAAPPVPRWAGAGDRATIVASDRPEIEAIATARSVAAPARNVAVDAGFGIDADEKSADFVTAAEPDTPPESPATMLAQLLAAAPHQDPALGAKAPPEAAAPSRTNPDATPSLLTAGLPIEREAGPTEPRLTTPAPWYGATLDPGGKVGQAKSAEATLRVEAQAVATAAAADPAAGDHATQSPGREPRLDARQLAPDPAQLADPASTGTAGALPSTPATSAVATMMTMAPVARELAQAVAPSDTPATPLVHLPTATSQPPAALGNGRRSAAPAPRTVGLPIEGDARQARARDSTPRPMTQGATEGPRGLSARGHPEGVGKALLPASVNLHVAVPAVAMGTTLPTQAIPAAAAALPAPPGLVDLPAFATLSDNRAEVVASPEHRVDETTSAANPATALGLLAPAGMNAGAAAPIAGTAIVISAEAHLAAPPGSPGFAPQLGTQLTTFVKDGIEHALLHLNPAEMGPVAVRITLDGQTAQVHLTAEQAQTRQALEQALPQLAGSLREAGLTLTGGGVFEQDRGSRQDGEAPLARERSGSGTGEAANGSTLPTVPTLPRRRGVVDLVA